MNIIQIQDRLKGVPDDALIGYVETPTGEVPSYLALSELQRRKDMRARYQTQAEPEKSISEQLIAESMPQGLGAMMPTGIPEAPQEGVGAPPPQPEMSPDMMTQAGVGSLPAPNIGQNYAGGGIVSFGLGGLTKILDNNVIGGGVIDRAIGTGLGKTFEYGLKGTLGTLKGARKNPLATGAGAYGLYNYFTDEEEADPKVLAALEAENLKSMRDHAAAREAGNTPAAREAEAPKAKSMSDYAAEFKSLLGEDKYAMQRDERLKKMDDRAAEQERRAPWMAAIEAGLSMAAGQSPDAITNIAAGATQGVKSYSEAQEAMQVLEEKRLALMEQASGVDRAEKLAAIKFGMDSKQFEETQALKSNIANQANALEMFKLNIDANFKGESLAGSGKDRAKVAQEVLQSGAMDKWKDAFLDEFGDKKEGSADYTKAYNMELNKLVNQRLRAGKGSGLAYLGSE
jgi:hypothetical protein